LTPRRYQREESLLWSAKGELMNYNRDAVVTMLRYGLVWQKRHQRRIAGYFACAALEQMLPEQVPGHAQGKERPSYSQRIEEFCKINGASRDVCEALRGLSEQRGNFLHRENIPSGGRLLTGLCEMFDLRPKDELDQMDYEDQRYLDKKIARPRGDEAEIFFCGFSERDFQNLFQMRSTMGALVRSLEREFPQQGVPLKFDQLSEVNPTSAYVWAAAVRRLAGDRPKLEKPSLSLLATNSELRVYLEFGGRSHQGRKSYYEALGSGKLDDALRGLDDGYRVFDIEWYFNVVPESVRTPKQFGQYLKDNPTEVATTSARLRESQKTLTWNRFLVGKTLQKRDLIRDEERVLPVILDVFKTLYRSVFRQIEA
jgi:hypothetical protein